MSLDLMLRLVLVKSQTRFAFCVYYTFLHSCLLSQVVLFQCFTLIMLFCSSNGFMSSLSFVFLSCVFCRHGWLRSMNMPNRMLCSCCLETRQGIMGNICDYRWGHNRTNQHSRHVHTSSGCQTFYFITNWNLSLAWSIKKLSLANS